MTVLKNECIDHFDTCVCQNDEHIRQYDKLTVVIR
jgi:hypothetical protein